MDIAGLTTGVLGLVVSVWALINARRAKQAADRAVRLVAKNRLATAFAQLEHASQMVGVARLHNLDQLFVLIAHEWRPIAAEVRALASRMDSGPADLLKTLSEVNTLMDIAREEVMNGSPAPLGGFTRSLARGMADLTDLVIESRLALEHHLEDQ
jgi:hypothetical protein